MKYSGLQLDVFKLYRLLLRTAKSKDSSGNLNAVITEKFREKAYSLKKTEFNSIEHQLRWGYKQKKLMELPSFQFANLVKNR
jgi:hypothetical protein